MRVMSESHALLLSRLSLLKACCVGDKRCSSCWWRSPRGPGLQHELVIQANHVQKMLLGSSHAPASIAVAIMELVAGKASLLCSVLDSGCRVR
jgi:hypothetical protein